MQEPYGKGAATPSWPRVLRRSSRGGRRSIDRGTGGQGIELRKLRFGCRPGPACGKATSAAALIRESLAGPGVVKDPEHAAKQYAREPGDLWGVPCGDRAEKVNSPKPDVYAPEESHDTRVPMKPPNNEAQPSAEGVEGRASIKENTCPLHTRPTLCGISRVHGADGCAAGRFALAAMHPR